MVPKHRFDATAVVVINDDHNGFKRRVGKYFSHGNIFWRSAQCFQPLQYQLKDTLQLSIPLQNSGNLKIKLEFHCWLKRHFCCNCLNISRFAEEFYFHSLYCFLGKIINKFFCLFRREYSSRHFIIPVVIYSILYNTPKFFEFTTVRKVQAKVQSLPKNCLELGLSWDA